MEQGYHVVEPFSICIRCLFSSHFTFTSCISIRFQAIHGKEALSTSPDLSPCGTRNAVQGVANERQHGRDQAGLSSGGRRRAKSMATVSSDDGGGTCRSEIAKRIEVLKIEIQ